MKENKTICHGNNLRLARIWKNMTQEGLADKLNIYQTDISILEQKATINDKMLDKLAKALDVPKDFFTTFSLEDTMNSYSVNNSEAYTMTTGNNATGNELNQMKSQTIEKQENTYYPLAKVTELYERLLEKEKEINELKTKLK